MNYEILNDVYVGFNGVIFDKDRKEIPLHPYYQKKMIEQIHPFEFCRIVDLPLDEYVDLTHFYGYWPFAHRYDALSRVRHIEDLVKEDSVFLIGMDVRNFSGDRFGEECGLFRVNHKIHFPIPQLLYRVKRLIYPHWIYQLGVGNESPVQFTDESFKYCRNKYEKIFNPSETKYKLFLTRFRLSRSITNFEEVHNFFKSNGFIIVDGKEDLKTTIDYFYNASIIVGVHGGLFSNLIFCNSLDKIVEVFPHEYFNGCFLGWKKFINIKYGYQTLIHESVDRKITFSQEDLSNLLKEALNESN